MIQTDRLYSTDDLYIFRQQDDEPLREYAARFSHEYSRCPETDDRAAFDAFKSGIRSSQFRYLVHSSNWTTYAELMKQAAIHAKAEYFNSKGSASATPSKTTTADRPSTQSHDQFPTNQTVSQAPYRTAPPASAPYEARNKRKDHFRNRQDSSKRGKDSSRRSDFGDPKKNRSEEIFTLLNTTYEHVLLTEGEMISKPNNRKLPRRNEKDTGVFCRYHQYNGHDTELCIALRKIVERLINEGKLDQYLNTKTASDQPSNRQINMISGGAPIAETSNRSVKNYVRAVRHPQILSVEGGRNDKTRRIGWEPITFSEEEERGVIFPHSDPMIIRADISDFDVGRILIDTGSSVNVLFIDAFNALGIDPQHLNKDITPPPKLLW
ncbi:uncharacterized protein LOC110757911 [Prunus avium]|uniref:Uncharacterized protein LOC110757911 n=1 Tax=Prunus avium TaxID=42229 RepID=A0A6P5SEL8_PRUAV|nr:uncharacterized protein LOC110757911 [Prunus avium]